MRGTVAHAHMHTRLQPDHIWRGSLVLIRSVISSGSVLRKEVARGVNVCLCASACGANVSTPCTFMHARISNTLGDNNHRGDGISLVCVPACPHVTLTTTPKQDPPSRPAGQRFWAMATRARAAITFGDGRIIHHGMCNSLRMRI